MSTIKKIRFVGGANTMVYGEGHDKSYLVCCKGFRAPPKFSLAYWGGGAHVGRPAKCLDPGIQNPFFQLDGPNQRNIGGPLE